MESHLDEDERQSGNRRNGKGSKQIKTNSGTLGEAGPNFPLIFRHDPAIRKMIYTTNAIEGLRGCQA